MNDDPLQHFSLSYHDQTTLHPLGVVAALILAIMVLNVRRQHVIWPIIILICTIPVSQRFVVLGADFTFLRILLIVAWIRLVVHQELGHFIWHQLDTAFLIWLVPQALLPIVLSGGAMTINRLGMMFDAAGWYFLFRILFRTWEDVLHVGRCFMWLSVPVALLFIAEWFTRQNVFAIFGGVPETTYERDGRLRVQGPFTHAILAGVFWASTLPFFAAMLRARGVANYMVFASVAAVLLIITTTNSATPLMAVLFGALGLCMWPIRDHMRAVRWMLFVGLLSLHLLMEAPVWHLIGRIDLVGGTGYHRYRLIQAAIDHIDEWWLVGSTQGTAHWGWGLWDVTNYYVMQGLNAGILQIILLLALLSVAFATTGRVRRQSGIDSSRRFFAWTLGVVLFTHVMNWFAVTYFSQLMILFYLNLAMIASADTARYRNTCVIRNSNRDHKGAHHQQFGMRWA